MYDKFRTAFDDIICPGADILEGFWNSQTGNPALESHPILKIPNWKRRAIPLKIHGDSVPVTGCGRVWSKSLFIISITGLLGHGSTMKSLFLMYAGFAHLLTDESSRALWKIICHSLTALWEGKHPAAGPDGKKYSANSAEGKRAGKRLFPVDKFFCIPWINQGDLEHYRKDRDRRPYMYIEHS